MSETKYRTQFETVPDAIFILQNNKFVDCNPQTLEIFKCGKEDIIEQTPYTLSPPTQPDGKNSKVKALEYINKALAGKPMFFEWQHCKLDGTLFDTEVSLKRFDIGNNIFLMAIVHDITDRKQAQIELAAEKERLAVTLESITDGVISTDVNGFIILMNKVAEEMTGWKVEEAIGLRIEDIFHIQDVNTHSPLKNPIHEIVASGKAIEFKDDIELIARDNTIRIISNCGGPIQNHLNEISGVVLVFKDVTESRKIEEQIFNARKLESAGVLAGGIAHDFNNILTGILGNVSLAKFYAKDNQKIFEKLVNTEKAALRARELTYQLLTFAKGGSPVKQTASIVELIKESIYFVLRGSNVKGEFHIPDDLWSVNIDKGQINQVFNNIVINADQAMPEGGIISISGENVTINEDEISTLKPGKYIKISIKDTGVGISPNQIKKIFDPYITTKSNGNGLGLTSSYSIVNKHGGNIIVESALGEGTVFHIYLPATGELIKTIDTREEPVKGKGRILLMDDEELVRHSAAAQLKFLGYRVDLVEDGNKLLKKFDEEKKLGNKYDLVILDLTIPGGMGGEKTMQLLRDIDPNVKAIVS
ncbi:MAG: PAS domain S-box protein, partial [Desulfobacterales bacterium]|nr:PAS domain S-box protein [Desulfobacterales bacterium]